MTKVLAAWTCCFPTCCFPLLFVQQIHANSNPSHPSMTLQAPFAWRRDCSCWWWYPCALAQIKELNRCVEFLRSGYLHNFLTHLSFSKKVLQDRLILAWISKSNSKIDQANPGHLIPKIFLRPSSTCSKSSKAFSVLSTDHSHSGSMGLSWCWWNWTNAAPKALFSNLKVSVLLVLNEVSSPKQARSPTKFPRRFECWLHWLHPTHQPTMSYVTMCHDEKRGRIRRISGSTALRICRILYAN